jgi:hypothetical protein
MTTSWHAEAALIDRYASGAIDDAQAFSMEAHLLACADCRRAVGDGVPPARLDAVWVEVAEAIDAPRPRAIERLLSLLGVRGDSARLLTATPSLQLSWYLAVGLALAFALLASRAEGVGSGFFLAAAPLVPVAGVAAAFGPDIDPAYEIVASAPMATFRLLLLRSAAVLATSLVLAGIAALGLPDLGWTAAAWVLPALGLTAASLALGSMLSLERAAAVVALAWLVVVATAGTGGDRLAAFHVTGQVVALVVAVASAVVILRRRDTFEVRSSL